MRLSAYTIGWSNPAAKQFQKIRDKKLAQRILEVIEQEIAHNLLVGKPLTEPFKGVRSYRVGRLRILYKPDTEKLTSVILRIDHRKSAYRLQ
jgi:mRNA-degrading endonuclease RelE of RelBE toxin-antitoxin system